MMCLSKGRRRRGLSLVELLVGITLGTLLLVALVQTASVTSQQVGDLRDDEERFEEVLAAVGDQIRHAWAASSTNPRNITLFDPYGNATRYEWDGAALWVIRPDGTRGRLLEGLTAATFQVETTPRLRNAPAMREYGTIDIHPGPADGLHILSAGQELALGFHLPANAPDRYDQIPGVSEQFQHSLLERAELELGLVRGGALNLIKGWIDPAAVPQPLWEHVTWMGADYWIPLGFVGITDTPPTSDLVLELYAARVPHDARPVGPLLGSITMPTTALPSGFVWLGRNKDNGDAGPGDGFWVEIERGIWDLDGADDVWVQKRAVMDGAAADDPDNPYGVDYVVIGHLPEPVGVPFDLTGFGEVLEPGQPYTLVVRVRGGDSLYTRGAPVAAATNSGVALRASPGRDFQPAAVDVPLVVEGTRQITQTTTHDAVSAVLMTLTLDDGRVLQATTRIANQTLDDDPWMGSLPAELPALELAGR